MGEPDENFEVILAWYVREYEATGNPFYAAEAFMLAVGRDSTPPAPIMKWLADGLSVWRRSDGEADVGKALGLTGGPGQAPAFKRIQRERRDAHLLSTMDLLIHLGATRTHAAELALSRPGTQDAISVETLVKMHKSAKDRPLPAEVLAMWDANPAIVSKFLSAFDTRYLSAALKSRL